MPATPPRQIRLGSFLTHWGENAGMWRHPDVPSNAPVSFDFVREIAQTAEAGKFDFVFVADSAYITKDSTPYFLSRFEPVTVLSAVAAVTKNLGLVGTMSTSYSEPFTTARQLASLDKLSGGRAGWNAVTSALEGVARNHGGEKIHAHALRYRIAREYIEVAKGLWDSWDDDAFVRDAASGVYADFSKMHTLDHDGEFFKVEGPLNMERSEQGRPIVFQAGQSEDGRDLAATHADAIFSTGLDLEQAKAFYADIRSRVVAHGRSADSILILPKINAIVGGTEVEARRLHEEANSYLDVDVAVKYLGRYFSFFDFSQFPLDEPLPDLGDIGGDSFRSTAENFKRLARENNWTLRQLAQHASNPPSEYVGTAEQIADRLQANFEQRACDGFIVSTDREPAGLHAFVDQVVPILQKRGLFRQEYEHSTLRGNLGLPFPKTRRAAVPTASAA